MPREPIRPKKGSGAAEQPAQRQTPAPPNRMVRSGDAVSRGALDREFPRPGQYPQRRD